MQYFGIMEFEGDKMSMSSRSTRGLTRATRGRRSGRLVPVKSRTTVVRRKARTDDEIENITRMYREFKKQPEGDIRSINYNLYSWNDILAKTMTKITTSTAGGTNSLDSIQMGTDRLVRAIWDVLNSSILLYILPR